HEGLRKAAEYCDCWADDFRLVMATIQSAARNGANITNYIKAIDIIKEKGTVAGVLAVDQFTGREIA
ncbi:MAG: glycerol-3-phosphate dehydrogenase, partial [Proteobacteria bacterium]|nr:glycerol-3-phosphate dehydrogenase [Pseudomonadota bacterium]